MATLVQSATNEGSGNVTATYGATPTEGNLLLAAATDRSGATSASMVSSGWTLRSDQFIVPGSGQNRRSLIVWEKIAGASESTTVTTNVAANTHRLSITEWSASGDLSFSEVVENDGGGDASDQMPYAIGATSSLASGSYVLIACVAIKEDSQDLPTSLSYSSENLVERVYHSTGGSGRGIGWGSLDLGSTSGSKNTTVDHNGGSGPDGGDQGTAATLFVYSVATSGVQPSVHDSLSTTEDVTPAMDLGGISVDDSPTVVEALGQAANLGDITLSDSASLAELIQSVLSISPDVNDLATITEQIESVMDLGAIAPHDSITIAEVITSATEAVTLLGYDDVSVAEVTDAVMSILLSSDDTISVAELTSIIIPGSTVLVVNEEDSVSIAEVIQAVLSDPSIVNADAVSTDEHVVLSLPIRLSVHDALSIAESVAAIIPISVSAFTVLTIAETIYFVADVLPDVHEQITLSESVAVARTRLIELFDAITISEFSLVVTVLAQGLATISVRQLQAEMTVQPKQASISVQGVL